jgi:hypothetical protein
MSQRYGLINEKNFNVLPQVLFEEGDGPKQPTEAQKVKTQIKQKQILDKVKDANEVANAERRDLESKTRESQAKLRQSAQK